VWIILNICILSVLGTQTDPYIKQTALVLNESDSISRTIPNKNSFRWRQAGFIAFSANETSNWQQSGHKQLNALLNYTPINKLTRQQYILEQKWILKYGLSKSNLINLEKTEDYFAYQIKWKLLLPHLKTPTIKFTNKANLLLSLKLQSQLSKTYKEKFIPSIGLKTVPISQFASPAYLDIQAAYSIELWKAVDIAISISSIKITSFLAQNYYALFNKNELFKVKKKEKIAFEHGYTLALDVEQNLFRNIAIKAEQKIFVNPVNAIQIDLESNTEINYALSKNLKLIFKHQLIFDADVSEQMQRQTLLLLGYYF
jgi:hypothetical protein